MRFVGTLFVTYIYRSSRTENRCIDDGYKDAIPLGHMDQTRYFSHLGIRATLFLPQVVVFKTLVGTMVKYILKCRGVAPTPLVVQF